MSDAILALALTPWALLILFGITILDGFFPPVPSEIALTTIVVAKLYAGESLASIALVLLVCVSGAICGDLIAHLLGRRIGTARIAARFPRLRQPLARAAHAFADHGPVMLISGRFVPGWRVALTMSSGVVGMRLRRFLLIDVVSACTWTVLTATLAATASSALSHPLYAVGLGVIAGTLIGALLGKLIAHWERRSHSEIADSASTCSSPVCRPNSKSGNAKATKAASTITGTTSSMTGVKASA